MHPENHRFHTVKDFATKLRTNILYIIQKEATPKTIITCLSSIIPWTPAKFYNAHNVNSLSLF